nr:venom peptide [Acharia stimulea]
MSKLCLLICVLVLVCILDHNTAAAQKKCQSNAAMCLLWGNKCCKLCVPMSIIMGFCA